MLCLSCALTLWVVAGIDALGGSYVSELMSILNRLAPLQPAASKRRPSDPWFNVDCILTLLHHIASLHSVNYVECTAIPQQLLCNHCWCHYCWCGRSTATSPCLGCWPLNYGACKWSRTVLHASFSFYQWCTELSSLVVTCWSHPV